MLGDDKTKQLTSDLTKLYEQKSKTEAGMSAGEQRQIKQDRSQMERAYQQEGHTADDLKPWNAEQEQRKYSHSPMEEFGSFGVMFAIAASAFTHTPATNALNAAAAYMNAVKQGDEDQYNKAFTAFKENSELAIKRADIERAQFEEANKLLDTDMTLWRAKTEAAAARFGNQKMLAFLRAGMDPEVIQAQEAQAKATQGMMEAREHIVEGKSRMDYIKAKMAMLPKEQQNDPQKYMQFARDYDADKDASTPEQQAYRGFVENYETANNGQQPPTDEIVKFLKGINEAKYGGRSSNTQGIALKAFMDENPNATAEQLQSFLQRGRSMRSPQSVAVAKYLEEHPDATSEDIEKFAGEFTSVQKADRDFATGKQGQQLNSLNVGISHIETLRQLGDALKNGDITRFNDVAQKWAAETGNPAPTNFDTAKRIVGTEIMKALVAGGGGVGEREAMQDSFSRAASPEAISGALDTAETLLAGQFVGLGKQYQQTTKRDDFEERLTPQALEIFNRIQSRGKKPPPVKVGPNTSDDADGTKYHKDGWIWEKQGDQLVPVEQDQ